MSEISSEITTRIKKSLKMMGETLEKEPVIVIEANGKHWLNHIAKEFISKRQIPLDDFMEWLKIGSSHLQKLTYCDINIHLMRLPGNDVIGVLKEQCHEPDSEKFNLTQKEKEVLGFLTKGLSNKKIADLIKISPGTVNSHLDSIYRKLGCSNRLEASFMALKRGLFFPVRKFPKRKDKRT